MFEYRLRSYLHQDDLLYVQVSLGSVNSLQWRLERVWLLLLLVCVLEEGGGGGGLFRQADATGCLSV